jgi:hypothetical protein
VKHVHPSRPHDRSVRISRITGARILVVVATLALWAGGFGVWVARQALNTDQWVETSSELLQDPAIQQAAASYLADQVVAPGATEQIEQIAPRIAGVAGGAVGDLAERAALRALRSGRFQQLWTDANRRAHERLISLIENEEVTEVALDLRPLVERLAARVGAEGSLPADAGRVEIISADQLETVRTVARLLRGVAIALLVLAVVLYGLAMWLAGPGRRQGILLLCGIGVVVAGLAMLVVRRVAGAQVVEAVTAGGAATAAAEATWTIGTELLVDIAGVTIVLGLVIVAIAWLAGPSRPAVWLRVRAAPVVRERPGVAYGVAIGFVLLLLAIGVLPAASALLAVLIYLLIAVATVAALQRVTPAG